MFFRCLWWAPSRQKYSAPEHAWETNYVNEVVDLIHAYAIIDIVKRALSISVKKIDNWNHQQNHVNFVVIIVCVKQLLSIFKLILVMIKNTKIDIIKRGLERRREV